jgi:anti-anti-sigma factor
MFHVEKHGDVAVLTAAARLEGSNRIWARKQFDELFEAGINYLILDFSPLEVLDSSGLGSVVVTFHRARKAGGNLCVCGLNEKVRMVFELTLLHEVIPIYNDPEESLRKIKND